MQKRELLLAHGVILVIAGASLWCIANATEIWPFSHYPMYSRVQKPSYRQLRMMGVSADGEVDLTHNRYWRPLSVAHIRLTLSRLDRLRPMLEFRHPIRAVDAEIERRRAVIADTLAARYRARRAAGMHDGPPLRGLRLYLNEWTLVSGAANADTPDRSELLTEISFAKRGPE